MLKSRLGMDSRTDALVRPDALELPTHFDAEEYEKVRYYRLTLDSLLFDLINPVPLLIYRV